MQIAFVSLKLNCGDALQVNNPVVVGDVPLSRLTFGSLGNLFYYCGGEASGVD